MLQDLYKHMAYAAGALAAYGGPTRHPTSPHQRPLPQIPLLVGRFWEEEGYDSNCSPWCAFCLRSVGVLPLSAGANGVQAAQPRPPRHCALWTQVATREQVSCADSCTLYCTVGWVNMYQKFEIEKYTICGKLILPTKKMERHFKKKILGTTGLRICMDL